MAVPKRIVHNFMPDFSQELLLKALLTKGPEALPSVNGWLETVDFDSMGTAEIRLMPMLYSRLQEFGIEHRLVGRIRGLYRRAWYVDTMMRKELTVLMSKVTAVTQPVVLLKGTALGLLVYSSTTHRPFGDFDLLVREGEQQRVIDALLAEGAHSQRLGFHAITVRLASGTDLDIHRSPYHDAFRSHHVDPLFSRLHRINTIDGHDPWYTLGDTDQLLHTLCHGLRPDPTAPIRWLVDSVLLVRRAGSTIDWNLLVQEARRLDFVELTIMGLKEIQRYEPCVGIDRAVQALESLTTPQALVAWRESFQHESSLLGLWDLTKRNASNRLSRLALMSEFIYHVNVKHNSPLVIVSKGTRALLRLGWALLIRSQKRCQRLWLDRLSN